MKRFLNSSALALAGVVALSIPGQSYARGAAAAAAPGAAGTATSGAATTQTASPATTGVNSMSGANSNPATTNVNSMAGANGQPASQSQAGVMGTGSHTPNGGAMVNPTTGAIVAPTAGTTATTGTTAATTNWNTENAYWRNHYPSRPYAGRNRDYSTYEPAYRYGMDMYNQNPGKRFEDLNQDQLANRWNETRGNSTMSWKDAQAAARDEYDRLYQTNHAAPVNATANVTR